MRQSKWFIYAAALAAIVPALCSKTASAAISDIYTSDAAGPYTITGNVIQIMNTSSTANTFLLQDGSGSVLLYNIPKTDYVPTLGDNITIAGITNSPYQDSPELTSTGLTTSSFTLNSAGNTVPTPTVLTIPQFLAAGSGATTETAVPPYAESIVTLDNVYLPSGTTSLSMTANTSYTITDGTNTATMYDYKTDSAVLAAVTASNSANTASSGALYSGPLDITGYVDVYYGVPEIYPTSIVAGTATPEPASLALIALGGVSLLGRRRNAR